MTEVSAFLGLFLSAFLATTLIPAQSELSLNHLAINTDYSMVLLVTVASLGNTTGAIINWFIGQGISNSLIQNEKVRASTRYRIITGWYERYGQWTLLFSWAQFIGDPITVISGIFKVLLRTFMPIVTLVKTSHYLVIATFAKKFVLGQ